MTKLTSRGERKAPATDPNSREILQKVLNWFEFARARPSWRTPLDLTHRRPP
jgi:hypothetical protein